jgi:hypothetical protein
MRTTQSRLRKPTTVESSTVRARLQRDTPEADWAAARAHSEDLKEIQGHLSDHDVTNLSKK